MRRELMLFLGDDIMSDVQENLPEPSDDPLAFSPEDIAKGKTCAILSYLFPAIFYLVMKPESKFARFHANFYLLLFIAMIVVSSVAFVAPILSVLSLALSLVWLFGFISAIKGDPKVLVIGGFIEDLYRKNPKLMII